MQKNDLKTINKEALQKEYKKYSNLLKVALIISSIIFLIVFGYIGYIHGQGKDTEVTGFLGTLFALSLGSILPAYISLSKVKKEIAKRKNNTES